MDLEKFIQKQPYLYHLTCEANAKSIIEKKKLFSANELIDMSKDESNYPIKRKKRFDHYEIIIEDKKFYLRDQRPISEKALSKCLTDGWEIGDFLNHLNDRVFMWPTLDRLRKHFKRYEPENPVILRFPTREIMQINPNVSFSRLNSGATRANSYLGGIAPPRGADTFLSAEFFNFPVGAVAEVTFEKYCNVNLDIYYSMGPDSQYMKV